MINTMKSIKRKVTFITLGLISFCSINSFAEAPMPSAEMMGREIEQEYEPKKIPQQHMPKIEIELPEKKLALDDKEKIYIRRITFSGNTIVKDKVLYNLASDYENKKLSMKDIAELCNKIRAIYIDKDFFLVRVYPPAQKIDNDVLHVVILEGKLGDIVVEGNQYYSASYIKGYFEKQVGRPINYKKLIKTLILLNGNENLQVEAIFTKGATLGTVEMIIKVFDGALTHMAYDTNNYGSPDASRWRSGIKGDAACAFVDGDKLTLIGVFGYPFNNLRFFDGIYDFPVNKIGTTLEVAYLSSDYRVVRIVKEMQLKGSSSVGTIQLTHALARTRRFTSNVIGCFEAKNVRTEELGNTKSLDKLRTLKMGLDAEFVDSYMGRNFFAGSLNLGFPSFLGGSAITNHQSSRAGAGGQFTFFTADFQRVQHLPKGWVFFFIFQGQYSLNKLPIPETYYVGGVNSVRGYSAAVALGDTGFITRFEVRFPISFFRLSKLSENVEKKYWYDVLYFSGFCDHGEAYVKGGNMVDQRNQVWMTSAGVGAHLYEYHHVSVDAEWGVPLTLQEKTSNSIFYLRVSLRI